MIHENEMKLREPDVLARKLIDQLAGKGVMLVPLEVSRNLLQEQLFLHRQHQVDLVLECRAQ